MMTADELGEHLAPLLENAEENVDAIKQALTNPEVGSGPRPWSPARYRAGDVPGIDKIWERVVSAVKPLLSVENPFIRLRSIQILALAPIAEAVDLLLDRFGDDYWLCRSASIEAIEPIKVSGALAPLVDCLGDEEEVLRVRAAAALGTLGEVQAIPALKQVLLNDDSDQAPAWAATAIGEIGGPEALQVLISALENKELNVDAQAALEIALARLGAPAIDALTPLAKSGEAAQRAAALSVLSTHGGAEIAVHLREALERDLLPHLQAEILNTLAKGGDEAAREQLHSLMFGDDEWIAVIAAGYALQLGDDDGLRRLLADYFSDERALLARAFLIQVPASILSQADSMLSAWSSEDMRRALCDVLGLNQFTDATPILTSLATSNHNNLSTTAIVALARLGEEAVGDLWQQHVASSVDAAKRFELAVGLGQLNRPIPLPVVDQLLVDSSAAVVLIGLELLADHESRDRRSRLVEVLARAQRQIDGDAQPFATPLDPQITDALVDGSSPDREYLPESLKASAESMYRDAFSDPNKAIVLGALHILAMEPGGPILETIRPFLADADPVVRYKALLTWLDVDADAVYSSDVDLSGDESELVRYQWKLGENRFAD